MNKYGPSEHMAGNIGNVSMMEHALVDSTEYRWDDIFYKIG